MPGVSNPRCARCSPFAHPLLTCTRGAGSVGALARTRDLLTGSVVASGLAVDAAAAAPGSSRCVPMCASTSASAFAPPPSVVSVSVASWRRRFSRRRLLRGSDASSVTAMRWTALANGHEVLELACDDTYCTAQTACAGMGTPTGSAMAGPHACCGRTRRPSWRRVLRRRSSCPTPASTPFCGRNPPHPMQTNVRVRPVCSLGFGRACTYATVLALLVLARSTIMPSGRWRVGCGICTVEKSRSVGLLNYRGSCVYYCGRTYDGRRGHGVVRWYVEPVEAAERRRHERRALDRKAVVILEPSPRPWRRRQQHAPKLARLAGACSRRKSRLRTRKGPSLEGTALPCPPSPPSPRSHSLFPSLTPLKHVPRAECDGECRPLLGSSFSEAGPSARPVPTPLLPSPPLALPPPDALPLPWCKVGLDQMDQIGGPVVAAPSKMPWPAPLSPPSKPAGRRIGVVACVAVWSTL